MRRRPRRAYMLVHIITWLPLIATGTTVAFMISAQSLRLQARERAQIATESVTLDLVRRIQMDARAAERAAVGPADAGAISSLTLVGQEGTICYQVKENIVTRTRTVGGQVESGYTWNLGNGLLVFRIESIGTSPGLVWMTFVERVPRDRTASDVEKFSATAVVGKGVSR